MNKFIVATILVAILIAAVAAYLSKPSLTAEAVCKQKGEYLVRTYSGTVCARLEELNES